MFGLRQAELAPPCRCRFIRLFNLLPKATKNQGKAAAAAAASVGGRPAAALPDTSPCDVPVRPMLVSRWSMLGTGWDSTALSSLDTV